MTRVKYNPWTRTFTLAHLVPLTVFSPTMLMTNAWYKIILKRSLYGYINDCPNCSKLNFELMNYYLLFELLGYQIKNNQLKICFA